MDRPSMRRALGRAASGKVDPVAHYDAASFAAGENTGTRIASCMARMAARDLMENARWWNRRRRGAMSSALIACAEELDRDADAQGSTPAR